MMNRFLKHSILALYIVLFVLSAPSYACSAFYTEFQPFTFFFLYILVGLMFWLCLDAKLTFTIIYLLAGVALIIPICSDIIFFISRPIFPIGLFPLLTIPYVWLMLKKVEKDASYKPLLLIGLIPIILQIYPLNNCALMHSPTLCQSNIKNIGIALDKYKEKNGAYPDKLNDLYPEYIGEKYLGCEPSDSFKLFMFGKIKERLAPKPYIYMVNSSHDEYVVYCGGYPNHKRFYIGPGYPMYSSKDGLIPRQDNLNNF